MSPVSETALQNSEFGFGGPDVYRYSEIVELAFRSLGKPPRLLHVPYWPIDVAAAAIRPFNRNAAGFLTFFRQSMSRDMVGIRVGQHHLWDYYLVMAGATDPVSLSEEYR